MILTELSRTLKELGLESGAVVCVFSDLVSLGLSAETGEVAHREGVWGLCRAYIETVFSVLGPSGTLLMPTFTYSAFRSEVYDPETTPSTVGLLTEVFRTQSDTLRSEHPIFSFAGRGPKAHELLHLDTLDCFGAGSFFDKMVQVNGYYLLLGTSFQSAATFMYHSLQKEKVPYRFPKEFEAKILRSGRTESVQVPYFARELDSNVDCNRGRIETEAIEQNLVKRATFAGGPILLTRAQAIDSFICEKLRMNPYYLRDSSKIHE